MSHVLLLNAAFSMSGMLLVSVALSGARVQPVYSPSRTALTVSLGALGVSFLVQSPMARGLQNELVVNLGQLTGNGTTLIAAYAMQVVVLHVLYPRAVASTRA